MVLLMVVVVPVADTLHSTPFSFNVFFLSTFLVALEKKELMRRAQSIK